jgi:hypothetical protein
MEPEIWSEQASVSPPEPVAPDAVGEAAAVVAVVPDAAQEQRQAAPVAGVAAEVAAWAGAAAQQREAAEAEVRIGGAAEAEEVVVPDARAQPRAALPSAAAWACRRGQAPRRPCRPAPQPAVRLARAMERQPIALPLEP